MINEVLGMQPGASEQAARLDYMLELLHWFVLVLFIPWSAFFVYTLVRFRQSKNPKADYHGVKGHGYKYTEVAVCVVEAVLLLGFALPLWAKNVGEFPPKEGSVVLRAVGEQFAWNIHYAGADGILGKADATLVTKDNPLGLDKTDPHAADDVFILNQLHLPVDRNAIVYISSKDVIHSFKLPSMRVCQDAMPGMTVPAWFKPTKTGKYEIVCAQLCGLGHYKMRGQLIVETQAEFDEWMKKQATGSGGSGGYE